MQETGRHCQTNVSGPEKGAGLRRSGRQLTSLGQRDRTVLCEDIAAVEVTVLVEAHCQTNLTGPAKGADLKRSGCKLTPLNQGSSAVLLEDIATVEVTVVVEVIVDRGMDSGKFL